VQPASERGKKRRKGEGKKKGRTFDTAARTARLIFFMHSKRSYPNSRRELYRKKEGKGGKKGKGAMS